jgi:ketosteroid isomerase-like protein
MGGIPRVITIVMALAMLQACSTTAKISSLEHYNSFNLETKSMTNLDIVKSTYEGKTSEENGKNLKRYITNETQWTEAAGFPYAGTYQGFDEIEKKVFVRLGCEWNGYNFAVEDYVAAGDKVFAYGSYSGTNKATGKFFKARVAHLLILKEGKIISFEQFVDSKTVSDVM